VALPKKKEKRAYGLAMQAVKDRQSKLDRRKEKREAEEEQIQDALKQKKITEYGNFNEEDTENNFNFEDGPNQNSNIDSTTTTAFIDMQEKSKSGEHIVVTTTTFGLSSDEDEPPISKTIKNCKRVDEEQKYAGNVQKYFEKLKGNLPDKKNKNRHINTHKSGRHGAEGMKGMGSAKDLKLAQKTLSKCKAKSGGGKSEQPGRRKKKR